MNIIRYTNQKSEVIRMEKVRSLVAIMLLFLAFFGLKILPIKDTQWDYILLFLLLGVIVPKITTTIVHSKMILTYFFFIILSCLYSWRFNDQSIVNVVVHSYKYFSFIFFFYIYSCKISCKEAENTLIIISIICCACYILQWLIYPTIIFYGADHFVDEEVNKYRVRIPGSLCCYCLLFYSVNQFLLTKKWKFIVYCLFGFLPILIMGFRIMIVLTLVSVFVMIPFVKRGGVKTIIYSIIGAVAVILLMQTNLVQSKIDEMNRRTESGQLLSNEDYIRWREFDYYWNNYFIKPGEKIIGGGVPCDPSSRYRKNIYINSYAYSDLGLVGLSMIIGIPAVLILIFFYLYCIWKFRNKNAQYLRFCLVVVLLGSLFLNSELYRDGNILIFSLILYINYKSYIESRRDIRRYNLMKINR